MDFWTLLLIIFQRNMYIFCSENSVGPPDQGVLEDDGGVSLFEASQNVRLPVMLRSHDMQQYS